MNKILIIFACLAMRQTAAGKILSKAGTFGKNYNRKKKSVQIFTQIYICIVLDEKKLFASFKESQP